MHFEVNPLEPGSFLPTRHPGAFTVYMNARELSIRQHLPPTCGALEPVALHNVTGEAEMQRGPTLQQEDVRSEAGGGGNRGECRKGSVQGCTIDPHHTCSGSQDSMT